MFDFIVSHVIFDKTGRFQQRRDMNVTHDFMRDVVEANGNAVVTREENSGSDFKVFGTIRGAPDKVIGHMIELSKDTRYCRTTFSVVLIQHGCERPQDAGSIVYIKRGAWKEKEATYIFPGFEGGQLSSQEYHYRYRG